MNESYNNQNLKESFITKIKIHNFPYNTIYIEFFNASILLFVLILHQLIQRYQFIKFPINCRDNSIG
jgi:hypothetical protein